jgi:hypothetical protein
VHEGAERATGQQFTKRFDGRPKATVVTNAERDACGPACSYGASGIGSGQRKRLFAKHVLAGRRGCLNLGSM